MIKRPLEKLVFATTGLVLAIQLAPIVVVVLVSVSASPVFDVTVGEFSARWWERLWANRTFWSAMTLSAQIAAVSTFLAILLGTPAAIAIARAAFPGRDALAALILSPLMLPGIVLGIAMLQGFKAYGLTVPLAAIVAGHVVMTLPFIVRSILAALALFDFTLIDAARTLGCSFPRAIRKVMIPALAPAYVSGGIFAFLASFDNYPISIFLADARTKTLPVQLLEYIEESPNPMIAAVSTLLLVLTIVALLALERFVGLRRAAAI
ncbi:MAG: ABC transporter permease [Alphaproteobacteria bacterium]|nr:ABC transporter permease [Alphaproteobacteria bacterium]